MTGSFRIKCYNPDLSFGLTTDIPIISGLSPIIDGIVKACPYYREKFDLIDGPMYPYYQDGRDLTFKFSGLNMDIPQWEILNSVANPVIGSNVFFNSTTWIPYSSQNLMYEPVPYEFLYTNETLPQVLVTVNGVEAACTSLKCGFQYIKPVSMINSFTISGNTLDIYGSGFTNDIQSISFSGVAATNIKFVSKSHLSC